MSSSLQTLTSLPTLPKLVNCGELKSLVFLDGDDLNLALKDWLDALENGEIAPDEKCLPAFIELATLLDPSSYAKMIVDLIINRNFYQFLPADAKNGDDLTDIVSKMRDEVYVSPDILQHLPPAIANLITTYHPNCSTVTDDGRRCGFGGSETGEIDADDERKDEFTFKSLPGTENYCQRECTSNLCPQWLASLGEHLPTVVTATTKEYKTVSNDNENKGEEEEEEWFKEEGGEDDYECENEGKCGGQCDECIQHRGLRTKHWTGGYKTLQLKIQSITFQIYPSRWLTTFTEGKNPNWNAEIIAAGCRLLNGPQLSKRYPSLSLRCKINFYETQESKDAFPFPRDYPDAIINFPELVGGEYFVNSWKWEKDFPESMNAFVVVRPPLEYEKFRNEQLNLRQLQRTIANGNNNNSSSSSSSSSPSSSHSLPQLLPLSGQSTNPTLKRPRDYVGEEDCEEDEEEEDSATTPPLSSSVSYPRNLFATNVQ